MEFHPFQAHWDCTGRRSSDIRHKSTPNEAQSTSGLYSTVSLYSDQPTHGIAPECRIHLPGVQNAQSKCLWHLTEKGNKSRFSLRF